MSPRLFVFVSIAAAALSACGRPDRVAIAPMPAPVVAYQPAPIALSPINANLSGAARVWHLRAALNVAALACRGADEAVIIARYNALLSSHRATLASAEAMLADEYRATGGKAWRDRYDDSMTRLYNFFSQAQARAAFCAAANTVLADASALHPDAMAAFATRTLPILDAPFARMATPGPQPIIALAAVAQVRATRTVPRLELDLSALGEP